MFLRVDCTDYDGGGADIGAGNGDHLDLSDDLAGGDEVYLGDDGYGDNDDPAGGDEVDLDDDDDDLDDCIRVDVG